MSCGRLGFTGCGACSGAAAWLMMMAPLCLPAQHAHPAAWSGDIAPALARAKLENKMVFVEIAPAWVDASKQLDAYVADPGVQKLLGAFIQVRIVPDMAMLRTISGELGIRDDEPLTCLLDANGGVAQTNFNIDSPAALSADLTALEKDFGLVDAPYLAKWNVSFKEGRLYRFEVSAEEIAKSPVWAEGDKSPPLSPRKAIQRAEAALDHIAPKAWSFDAVRLTPLDDKGHWIYRVVFSRAPPPLLAAGFFEWMDVSGADMVPVLMNGYVPDAILIYDGPYGGERKLKPQ